MAKFTCGPIVEDIRGTLNNTVFSVAKGGVHTMRRLPASVHNPSSIDQGAARARFHEAAVDWDGLTAGEQAAWEEVAVRCAGLAKLPGGGIESIVPPIGFDGSGFNAYVAFRTRARLAGYTLAEFNTAWRLGVAVEDQPTEPTISSFVFAAGTGTVTYTDPITCDIGAKVTLWARSRDKVYHPQVNAYNALAVLSFAVTQLKAAKGQNILFTETTGGIVIAQLQTINPSGWASPGSNSMEATIA